MMTDARKGMIIFIFLGLIAGTLFDLLHHYQSTHAFYYSTLFLFFLFFGLCYNEKNNGRLVLSSFILALVLSTPLITFHFNTDNTAEIFASHLDRLISFLVGFPFFVYAAHAFHYTYHHDDNWEMNYKTLFSAVWDSFVLIAAACVFAGIAKLLIIMAAGLFRTVGNDFLWNLYYNNFNVYVLVDSVLFYVGLGIAHQNHTTIHNLRFLLLRMLHFLLPLLAIISIVYFILYLISLLQPVQATGFLPPEALLTVLVALGVIFFNAHFQTGEEKNVFSSILTLIIKIYRIVLLCLCVILTYRILSHFQVNINFGLYLLIALLFCFTYAYTAFLTPEQQRGAIIAANKSIALLFLFCLLIINNPLFPVTMRVGSSPSVTTVS